MGVERRVTFVEFGDRRRQNRDRREDKPIEGVHPLCGDADHPLPRTEDFDVVGGAQVGPKFHAAPNPLVVLIAPGFQQVLVPGESLRSGQTASAVDVRQLVQFGKRYVDQGDPRPAQGGERPFVCGRHLRCEVVHDQIGKNPEPQSVG